MSLRNIAIAVLSAVLLLPASTYAQSLWNYVDELSRESQARYAGVDIYVRKLKGSFLTPMADGSMIGTHGECSSAANCQVYKLESVGDGRVQMRLLSQLEVYELAGISPGSQAMSDMGTGFLAGQLALNEASTGQEDPTGNLAAVYGYLNSTGDSREAAQKRLDAQEPWTDPFALMGAGGLMMIDTSEAMEEAEESLRTGAETARREAEQQAALMRQFEFQGVEEFGGVQSRHYYNPSPNIPMEEVDGQQVTWDNAGIWIDPERKVLLGHRFEGTMEADGQSREFYLQVTNSDFRNPPGCGDMLEPYTQTMEMGGMLDDEQMAQMEEAKRQLEEFDRQMASMPADQRQMMENMMGGQMETIRNMAAGGGMTFTMETEEIICNPDLHALFAVPGMEDGALPTTDNLLVQIQNDLVTLGYEPGNTDGVLDTMTQVAISQFQAEAGMTVTGEPSPALANALRTAVAGQ